MTKIKKAKNTIDDTLPAVSVVIISKNNHELLAQAISSIGKVDYPPQKMQVVVFEETDHPQPLDSWVEYHTIPVTHRGFGYARNKALAYATHSIIIFTDDDCTVGQLWIRELVTPLIESEQILAVGGSVFVPPCSPVGECENIIGFPGGGIKYYHLSGGKLITRTTFSTCNCAIRKSVIDSLGGFDESMRYGGEDEQLSRAITKGGIVYNPHAIVYHKPRDSVKAVFSWFVRRGFSEIYYARNNQNATCSVTGFLKNAPIVRIGMILTVSLLSGLGSLLLFPAMSVYYMILLWKFRWARRYYPSTTTYLLVPVVRTVMDIGRDVGIIKGFFLTYRINNVRKQGC